MTLPAQRYRAKKQPEDDHTGNFGFDVDGVIDAFPRQIGTLIAALHAAAHGVFVITGVDADTVTPADVKQKKQFLASIGVGEDTYTDLIVTPRPHAENKAKAIEANGIRLMVDNSKPNVKAATKAGCVGLLLWNTKEK